MFAIVKIKGFQYFAKPGEKLIVPRFNVAPDTEITLDDVIFLKTDNQTIVGTPAVKGATITAKIVRHLRAPKVTIFKFIRRENYRRLKGHKQPLSEIQITKIDYLPNSNLEITKQ
ncbi:MAG: 50S ribosomal protein L21 [candidate division WOR-3 bacterium]|nr:50S ribosomal protein L21 [candidate division WOR-3 bacterium]